MTTIAYSSTNYITKKPKTSVTELLLVGVVGFFGAIGTGGFTSQREALEHAAYVIPVNDDLDKDDKKTYQLTIPEQLTLIKESFGLNMSAMADLLNVSRPTVYSWIKGEPPKSEEHMSHAAFVTNIAEKYSALNLERPDNFIKRPLFEGESLFSLLKLDKEVSEKVYVLIKELDLKESNTRAAGLRKNDVRIYQDILDDLI